MPIEKAMNAPNGAPVSYHQVSALTVEYPTHGGSLLRTSARVNSWRDFAAYEAKEAIAWQWNLDGVLTPAEFANAEQGLIDGLASPLVGGLLVDSVTPALPLARLRKLVEINQAFGTRNNAALVTPFGLVDGDDASKTKITQAVTLWQALARLDQAPATIEFTLHDDSQVTITPTQLDTIGALLGAREQTLRGVRNGLRTAVAAAANAEEVAAVAWPVA